MAGKRSDIQAQIDALSKELESAEDDGLELLVEKDGARTVLRGNHAQKWLRKLGLEDDDAGAGGDGGGGSAGNGDGDQGDGDQGDAKPAASHRYFK